MTPQQLQQATGCAAANAEKFAGPLSAACAFYGIDTPERLAAFLAQIGHESASLAHTTELWGPTEAQRRYEGRADLGNTHMGDGERFKGHGLIQTTGRYNHARVRDRLRERFKDVPDFEVHPEALAETQWAALSAADYWDWKGLNAHADAGNFDAISDLINRGRATPAVGDSNGYADRLARWERAKRVLLSHDAGTAPPVKEPPQTLSQEKPMAFPLLPLAGLLIDIFSPLAKEKITKEMAQHSGSPQVVDQIAQGVIDAARTLTQKDDPVQAVAAVRADPALLAQAEAGAIESMTRLLGVVERVNDMEQKNIATARVYNEGEPLFLDFGWLKLKFIHLLSLLFMGFSGWFVVQNWAALTPELKGAVVSLMMIAGYNGVRDYWMGSSSGSDRKTAMLTDKDR